MCNYFIYQCDLVRGDLEEEIKKRGAVTLDEYCRILSELAKKHLSVNECVISSKEDEFERTLFDIAVDGYQVLNIDVDSNDNFLNSCDIPKVIPLEYLFRFRGIISSFLEEDSLPAEDKYHSSGVSFFVQYFVKFHDILDKDYVKEMCTYDDFDAFKGENGFRNWLIGDSYKKHGWLRKYRDDWSKKDFKKKKCPLESRAV